MMTINFSLRKFLIEKKSTKKGGEEISADSIKSCLLLGM